MICLAAILGFLAACSTSSDKTRSDATKQTTRTARTKKKKASSGTRRAPERGTEEIRDDKPVPKPTAAEVREFNRIWELYRKNDRRWPLERDRYKIRSEAAGYVLAGHMLNHYMVVNSHRDRAGKQLVGVKNEIVAIGKPCVPFLVNLMVLDRVPTPDGQQFVIDDLTRQDCIDMLERIGSAAVPDLLRAIKREDLGVKGRRLAVLALGGTKDPRAYNPLVKLLLEDPSWQVRADAATALGKLGDQRAVRPLSVATQKDPDPAVVKRAGKVRYQLLSGRDR
jgi:hypothetical protein